MKRALPPFPAVRAFEAAARHLSFRRAADELDVTQSAVSHQVRSLEEHVGRELFVRTAQGVTLTRAGARYLRELSPLLDGLESSTRRLRDHHEDRTLHVQSTPAFANRWLGRRIQRFRRACPGIELHVVTTLSDADFAGGNVDVLIQYGREPCQGLRVEPFLVSRRFPVCSPDYLAEIGTVRTPADLARCTLLRDEVGDDWERWFRGAGISALTDMHGPCFEHCDLTLGAAERGQGVALAYGALVAEDLASGTLVRLFDLETPEKVIYSITCPEGWEQRPAVAGFRDWLMAEAGGACRETDSDSFRIVPLRRRRPGS